MTILSCIDLFAGAGGLSTGLEMAGFECLYANEISPHYSETLRNNHPKTIVDTRDIRQVSAAAIRSDLGLEKGELSLLAGGPPCQGFSVNAPVRCSEDERNHLFKNFLGFAKEFKPRSILIENVPGMLSFEGGQTVREVMKALSALGYAADVRILCAANYGVPQIRWRTIFLANREGVPPQEMYPLPSHLAFGRANFTSKLDGKSLVLPKSLIEGSATNDFVTVGDAICDLPEIMNGSGVEAAQYSQVPSNKFLEYVRGDQEAVSNHFCSGLGKTNLERLPFIPQGGSWRDIPFELLPAGMKRARRSDHTKRYGRLDPDGIASTILTKCDPHWGTYIHPTQDRVLSVREAARLQSFPDRIEFSGSLKHQYEQVGNAVPPLFAKAIGMQVIRVLSQGHPTNYRTPWEVPQLELRI